MTMKMKVKVAENNIRNGATRWQISKSIKDISHFGAEDTSSSHFYRENLGQSRSNAIRWRISICRPIQINKIFYEGIHRFFIYLIWK